MKHRLFTAAALVLALSLLLSFRPVFASVDLVFFRAAGQADNTVLVTWQTATERGTVGFRLHRAEVAQPTSWGEPITTVPAQGNAVTGADYQYADANVTSGVKYYYLLREVSSSSTADFGPVSAGVGVPTDTPTPTPTATSTISVAPSSTPTWTRSAVANATALPTATRPAPTATRRFTETPVVSPLATPTSSGGAAGPLRTPTRTPLPGAQVATPTGMPLRVTAPPPATATPTPTLLSPIQPPTLTPTFAVVAVTSNQFETATPRPTKEITPVIFAAETVTSKSATPQTAEQVAGQGSRNTSLALVIGGSAIGIAALVAAGLLFMRSRRS